MKCSNLLKSLEDMIVNELLKLENATYFFLDAILVSNINQKFSYHFYSLIIKLLQKNVRLS